MYRCPGDDVLLIMRQFMDLVELYIFCALSLYSDMIYVLVNVAMY